MTPTKPNRYPSTVARMIYTLGSVIRECRLACTTLPESSLDSGAYVAHHARLAIRAIVADDTDTLWEAYSNALAEAYRVDGLEFAYMLLLDAMGDDIKVPAPPHVSPITESARRSVTPKRTTRARQTRQAVDTMETLPDDATLSALDTLDTLAILDTLDTIAPVEGE